MITGSIGVIMYKKTLFLITGSIVMAAVVTLYSVNVANAQLAHVPTKSMNMTAGGGNMTKSMKTR
jgi:hypothetical protein